MPPAAALILDRDGVINVDRGYVHRPEQCEFVAGIFDVLKAFKRNGFLIVIATNQAGIGRGLYSEETFQAFTSWMRDRFREHDIEISRVYHCPDHPTEGKGIYRRTNDWRKPGPGMFLQAAKDLELDMAKSWTIGDKLSDIEAGRLAGVGNLVLLNRCSPEVARIGDVWHVPKLTHVVELLSSGGFWICETR